MLELTLPYIISAGCQGHHISSYYEYQDRFLAESEFVKLHTNTSLGHS
jgi:hypothetical protein